MLLELAVRPTTEEEGRWQLKVVRLHRSDTVRGNEASPDSHPVLVLGALRYKKKKTKHRPIL